MVDLLMSGWRRAAVVALVAVAATSARAENDPVLIRHGDVAITRSEFRQFVEMAVPEEARPVLWADEEKVRMVLADMFLVRELAAEAKRKKLDEKPEVAFRLDHQERNTLAQVLLQNEMDTAKVPDLEPAAREYYIVHKQELAEPEKVSAAHILIATDKRDDAEARKLIEQVHAEAVAGKTPFAELAQKYSDDPGSKGNGGELGFFQRGQMVKPFEDAAFAMKKSGEISEPVKTPFGYHIIRFGERQEARVPTFEQVKARLMQQELDKFKSGVKTRKVESVRSLPGIEVDQQAVSALVVKSSGGKR